jgi:hypothetical protein
MYRPHLVWEKGRKKNTVEKHFSLSIAPVRSKIIIQCSYKSTKRQVIQNCLPTLIFDLTILDIKLKTDSRLIVSLLTLIISIVIFYYMYITLYNI